MTKHPLSKLIEGIEARALELFRFPMIDKPIVTDVYSVLHRAMVRITHANVMFNGDNWLTAISLTDVGMMKDEELGLEWRVIEYSTLNMVLKRYDKQVEQGVSLGFFDREKLIGAMEKNK